MFLTLFAVSISLFALSLFSYFFQVIISLILVVKRMFKGVNNVLFILFTAAIWYNPEGVGDACRLVFESLVSVVMIFSSA